MRVLALTIGLASILCATALAQSESKTIKVEPLTTSEDGESRNAVVVVRPAAWAPALTAWKLYRQAQGHEVIEVDTNPQRELLLAEIRKIVSSRRGSSDEAKHVGYIVLMGDAPVGQARIQHVQPKLKANSVTPNEAWTIPTWYRNSTAMVKFGCDEILSTDAPYSDIDGDDVPDLAIGRIPADTPESLHDVLERVIAYEKSNDYGTWRRDVRVVAGVGGFGALADSVIEMTTRRFLTDRVPQWADVRMTYASPSSPYCPDPLRFTQATVDQLNAGSMFWVYVGHGHVRNLDFLQIEKDWFCILHDSQLHQVDASQRPPIAVFLACYTGAFDAQEDCIAEQLVLNPAGPVAAIAATRVTGPYGLSTLASGVLDQCFEKRTHAIGTMLLHAKRHMLTDWPVVLDDGVTGGAGQESSSPSVAVDSQMQMITSIASALSPQGHDLLAERREHVWQVNLLGDPLLRVQHPKTISLDGLDATIASAELDIRGVAPHAGKLTIQLARRRDQTPNGLYVAQQFTRDQDVREKMHESYLVANDRVVVECTEEVAGSGVFQCKLKVPDGIAPGRYDVRAFLAGERTWAAGHTPVQVKRTGVKLDKR